MAEAEIMQFVNTFGVPAVLMIWLFRLERHHSETIAYYRRKEAFYISQLVSISTGKKVLFDPDPDVDGDTLPNLKRDE